MSAATSRACAVACEQAERAVRELIHQTKPAAGGLTDPAGAADVITAVGAVSSMLPQLLDQLGRWLLAEHDNGRMGIDTDAPDPDARYAVHATVAALQHAGACLHRAADAADTAHQHAAHLATHHRAGVGRGRAR